MKVSHNKSSQKEAINHTYSTKATKSLMTTPLQQMVRASDQLTISFYLYQANHNDLYTTITYQLSCLVILAITATWPSPALNNKLNNLIPSHTSQPPHQNPMTMQQEHDTPHPTTTTRHNEAPRELDLTNATGPLNIKAHCTKQLQQQISSNLKTRLGPM